VTTELERAARVLITPYEQQVEATRARSSR
jgi:hypothetical protein